MTSVFETAPYPDIDSLLSAARPRLHRYCARMVGSVIDGEDVLQDALIKAVEAYPVAGPMQNAEGWLFRIVHNTALDFLRRRNRHEALLAADEVDMIADQLDIVANRQIAASSLRTFMGLPVAERSSVILMDVLGYSLQEICEIMGYSLPATKAALHRGRARLRELAEEPYDTPRPQLSHADRVRLSAYVDRFNARDFDAIRAMIADDIKVDVVSRARLNGKAEASRYFGNYASISGWHLVPGFVEGHPAILVFDQPASAAPPRSFMLIDWSADKVVAIRDFLHAGYVVDGAEYQIDSAPMHPSVR